MQSIYNGVELAVTQLNGQRTGGKLPLRMIKGAPDVSDPIRIADAFRDNPSVVGVVGHPESGTTLDAIGEYADTKNGGRNAVVAISPTGTSPALSGAKQVALSRLPERRADEPHGRALPSRFAACEASERDLSQRRVREGLGEVVRRRVPRREGARSSSAIRTCRA